MDGGRGELPARRRVSAHVENRATVHLGGFPFGSPTATATEGWEQQEQIIWDQDSNTFCMVCV